MKKSIDDEEDSNFEPEDGVVSAAVVVGEVTVDDGIPVLPPIVKDGVGEDDEEDEPSEHFVFKKLAKDAMYTDPKQFISDFNSLYSSHRNNTRIESTMKSACLKLVNTIYPPKKLAKKIDDMRYPTNLTKALPTIDVQYVPKILHDVIETELFVGTYPHPFHAGEYYFSIFPQRDFSGCTPTRFCHYSSIFPQHNFT